MNSDIRLVLLGKTGAGKSSLGNSLLWRKEFKSSPLQITNTSKPECRRGSTQLVDGTKLVIVDTPGIADTKVSTMDTFDELTRCIELSHPGPHAFLLVLKIDRFTQEEMDTIKHLKYWFGQDIMKYAIFVFTGKDSLNYAGLLINEHVQNSPTELKDLIAEAGGRFTAINTRGRGPELEIDVNTIMTLVKQTMRVNNDQHYTQQMYSQAVKARKGQTNLVEDEEFQDIKDLRLREIAKKYKRQGVERGPNIVTWFLKCCRYLYRAVGYVSKTIFTCWTNTATFLVVLLILGFGVTMLFRKPGRNEN
ncbi:GTPase IMAP family member 4-like [Patella vulgata]|uniref:GTPase IMAP family member 4-like n=1 Tax=Patella vulgata TaxID=6465 RepID=UPI0024A902B9|nr:GTPase IMAP family member 4-like [Patella vulgata]